ncbi:MAG: magnesium and cobalt transport protein CorA, partial [Ignavibacteriaceae bacterium]
MKRNKKGMSPGSLVFTGEKKVEEIKISAFDFNASRVHEINISEQELSKLKKYKSSKNVTWINICGIHNTQVIDETGKIFGIHPLVLEDILNVNHGPKSDEYDDYVFIVTKMISYNNELNELNIE